MTSQSSRRTARFTQAIQPFLHYFNESSRSRRLNDPGVSDFAIGNPQDMPLPGFVNALQKWSVPQNKDWFAYKMNEEPSRKVIAESLRAWRKQPFEAQDIFLTTGGFAAITVALAAVVDPGDEVIFNSPPWFFYEAMIACLDAEPVRVKVRADNFDLDLKAIEAAITDKTRAIIVNSPNNPTGKIYPPETLKALAELLTKASQRIGRTIYMLSDEAYSRIVYDGATYHSPTEYYPNSFLLYTYGKTLLTPGQRIGYVALPPTMPDRPLWRDTIFTAQIMTGYAMPNALLQHALGDLEKLSIDIEQLQERRDKLVTALRGMGYELHVPEGTFYLLVKSPWQDDWAFSELLSEHDVFVLPGEVVEWPGYFRVSLTASDDMIERGIPRFAAAREQALKRDPAQVKR